MSMNGGGGAVEPSVWISGGDINLGEINTHNEMKTQQPPKGYGRLVQVLGAGGFVQRHGDLALAQHVTAYQHGLPDRGGLGRHV